MNLRIYFVFLETLIIGLHFACNVIDLSSFKFFTVGSARLSYFCKWYVSAVQGHPRSLILVLIESAFATSY